MQCPPIWPNLDLKIWPKQTLRHSAVDIALPTTVSFLGWHLDSIMIADAASNHSFNLAGM